MTSYRRRMRSTVGRDGLVSFPKRIRDRLGIQPGTVIALRRSRSRREHPVAHEALGELALQRNQGLLDEMLAAARAHDALEDPGEHVARRAEDHGDDRERGEDRLRARLQVRAEHGPGPRMAAVMQLAQVLVLQLWPEAVGIGEHLLDIAELHRATGRAGGRPAGGADGG